jgi:AraC-like DNA-binding protein
LVTPTITLIKSAFRAVYGVPLYAYIRTQKMESAAYMLEHTDKSVLQIAGEHGYDNGSKFASAFRQVKGMTPSAYRAAHRCEPNS